jgi:hypothetical protein
LERLDTTRQSVTDLVLAVVGCITRMVFDFPDVLLALPTYYILATHSFVFVLTGRVSKDSLEARSRFALIVPVFQQKWNF